MLSNFAFAQIVAVLNKDLKLYDKSNNNKEIYLKRGSVIYIEDKLTSARGVAWYKIKDGYVNSKYVTFVYRVPKKAKKKHRPKPKKQPKKPKSSTPALSTPANNSTNQTTTQPQAAISTNTTNTTNQASNTNITKTEYVSFVQKSSNSTKPIRAVAK